MARKEKNLIVQVYEALNEAANEAALSAIEEANQPAHTFIPVLELKIGDKLAEKKLRGGWRFQEKVTKIVPTRKGQYLIVNDRYRFDPCGMAVVMVK